MAATPPLEGVELSTLCQRPPGDDDDGVGIVDEASKPARFPF